MIITKVERVGDLIIIRTDAYPDFEPAFELHDVANGSQLVDKLKDRLKGIIEDPTGPADPYEDKFAHLKTELTGLDIGEL